MNYKKQFMLRAVSNVKSLCWGLLIAVSAQSAVANVANWSDYSFRGEITSIKSSTTGWQNIVYSGSQIGTTEFLIVSFSHGNPPDDQMIHIYKHKTQGGGWVKAVTAGNDDKSAEIWVREVTSANLTSLGQIETGGAGAVHAGCLAYRGKAVVTDIAAVRQTSTTTIAINNNGVAPYLIVAASDNGTPESDIAKMHFAPGDDRVFIYLTNTKAFRDTTTGTLRGAIASLALADTGTQTTLPVVSFLAPTNLTVKQGTNLYVKVSATDPDGISRVYLSKNGVELARSEGGAPYEWNAVGQSDAELKNLQPGTFTLKAKAVDTVGSYAEKTITITVQATNLPSQTVTFTSFATEDGYVNESAETTNIGGSLNVTNSAGAGLRIGDMSDKKQVKTILSFDTSSIPDGAVIQSATLKLMRGTVSGTPTTLGLIKVDIKGGTGFNNATALSKEDFQAAADATNVATMSYPSANGTLSTGSLSATGLTKVNKTGKTQLRMYFATDDDNDTTSDYLGFYPAENATAANRPVLEITYQ